MRKENESARFSREETERAAGALYALAGGEAPAYVLRALAQAMYDMTESGDYGTGLARVLRYHFPAPADNPPDACRKAVREVFYGGRKRNGGWKIYQICPFERYADGKGVPKLHLLAPFFERYDYLGCDRLSRKRGFIYFGRRRRCAVRVGSFTLRAAARRMMSYLAARSLTARVVSENGAYGVCAGSFETPRDAQGLSALIGCFTGEEPMLLWEWGGGK